MSPNSLLSDMKYREELGSINISTQSVISSILKSPKGPSGTNGQKHSRNAPQGIEWSSPHQQVGNGSRFKALLKLLINYHWFIVPQYK